MNEQHHGNLLGGAMGETAQTTAQLATIIAVAGQTAVHTRARELRSEHAHDRAAGDAERAMLRSEHAAARLTWTPALEQRFMTTASATEAATAWAAAQPWIEHDTSAREVARRAEERLDMLIPELIDRYRHGLADGLEPVDAMVEATAILERHPGDVNDATAAQAVAGDERGEALRDSATPDVAATVTVDEHTQGLDAGASHAAAADAATARAALLAAQAYPRSLRLPVHASVTTKAVGMQSRKKQYQRVR